jgi:predicted nucleic acid-binding Zn ribbon protein
VKRRPFRVQEEPEATADLMAGLISRMGGTGRALEYRVFAAYSEAAGGVLRARTTPDSFRDGTLFIRVGSSALAHELTLLRAELLERLRAALGPGVVTAIRTRVGSNGLSDPRRE